MRDPMQNASLKTKLIATLGPACATRQPLTAMFALGLDVCRLNFSHGSLDDHERLLELVRSIATERNQGVCIVGDLGGPKIRLGRFDKPVEINPGDTLCFVRGDGPCTAGRLTTTYPGLIADAAPGQRVIIDDGLVRLVVKERRADELLAECQVGGRLDSHKGVNLPDTPLTLPALTEKDRRDLQWAIAHDLDYVALSFVRQPEDLYELRRLIKQHDSPGAPGLGVIVKIEKAEALCHVEELVTHADGVLVARGDLGVETDLWRVPLVQKDVVAECQQAGVPVIVATQMLQSMIESPLPTRAEVSDVANAIFDRADAVMLSGETAVGHHPTAAVEMMCKVAAATEAYLGQRPPVAGPPCPSRKFRPTAAVAHAAVDAARDLGARLVAVWSATGATVRMVARHRLPMPVLGLSYDARVCRQMNLLYGVIPVRVEPLDNPAAMAAALDAVVLERKLATPGDLIVVVTSTKPTTPGATDTVLLRRVGEVQPSR